MKKLFFLLPLFLIAACDAGNRGADGHTFLKEDYVKLNPQTVTFVPVDSPTTLKLLFKDINNSAAPEELMAFSVLKPARDECVIYFIDSRVDYQPEWVGHETVHCVYGRFHAD